MPAGRKQPIQRRFFLSSHLDQRGPYKRERRRQLEVAELHPPRIRISARLNGWLVDEILAWEDLVAAGLAADAMRQAIRGMVAARALVSSVQIAEKPIAAESEAVGSTYIRGSAA